MDTIKDNILQASAVILLEKDQGRYTMDHLAADLNRSKKTIYKYFDSKQALIRSVIKIETQKIERTFQDLEKSNRSAEDRLIETVYLIDATISKIQNSILYKQMGDQNLFIEHYFDLRVSIFETYLQRFLQPLEKKLCVRFKSSRMMTQFVIATIEGHYFYTLKDSKQISDKDFTDGLAFLIHNTLVNTEAL